MTLKSGARPQSFVHTTDDGSPLASCWAAAGDYDARLRVYRGIVARRGQAAFRAALLEAFGGECSIIGCENTQ